MSEGLFRFSGLPLRPDPSRTVIKPFDIDYPEPFRTPSRPRTLAVIERALSLGGVEKRREVESVVAWLSERRRTSKRSCSVASRRPERCRKES